jgi:adenosylcobyric acid synthase
MLGETVDDPHGLESTVGEVEGLKLLALRTVLASDKTSRVVRATTPSGHGGWAYEIHLGVSTLQRAYPPFAILDDGSHDGARGDRVIGTYLHGALEDAAVLSELLGVSVSAPASKADQYAALADWFERYAAAPESWIL